MQPVIFQPTLGILSLPQATRVIPEHGKGAHHQAVNDEHYRTYRPLAKAVVSVLANVIGGGLMILGMFFLPYIIGNLL